MMSQFHCINRSCNELPLVLCKKQRPKDDLPMRLYDKSYVYYECTNCNTEYGIDKANPKQPGSLLNNIPDNDDPDMPGGPLEGL